MKPTGISQSARINGVISSTPGERLGRNIIIKQMIVKRSGIIHQPIVIIIQSENLWESYPPATRFRGLQLSESRKDHEKSSFAGAACSKKRAVASRYDLPRYHGRGLSVLSDVSFL